MSVLLVGSCQDGNSSDNGAPIVDDQKEAQNCQADQSNCTPSLQLAAMQNIRSCMKSHSLENKIDAFELVRSFDDCQAQNKSNLAFAAVMAGFARITEDGAFILGDTKQSK